MTNKGGPDDKDAGAGKKDQRPYATLDLTASEVSSSGAGPQSEKPRSEADEAREQPRLEKPEAGGGGQPPARDGGLLGGVATHMAAGAFGAVLALIFGAWIYDGGNQGESPALEQAEAMRAVLTDAEARIAALETGVNTASARAEEAARLESELSALTQRFDALERRPAGGSVTEQSVQQSLDPISTRLAEMERRVAAIAEAQQQRQVSGKAMAVSLAFYNLQKAAREGRPYARELGAVAQTAPVPLDLGPLESWRDDGVQSLDQIRAGFDAAAAAALDAENQPEDDSLASELWSQAKSFVRIQRKGDVPGDATPAILARVEHRLDNGDPRAALAEGEKLQGAAAEAFAPWLASLKSRIAVDEALAAIEGELIGALGGSPGAEGG